MHSVQGFDIAAMYDDLSTLEVKLNQLLESKGVKPLEKAPGHPNVPATQQAVAAH